MIFYGFGFRYYIICALAQYWSAAAAECIAMWDVEIFFLPVSQFLLFRGPRERVGGSLCRVNESSRANEKSLPAVYVDIRANIIPSLTIHTIFCPFFSYFLPSPSLSFGFVCICIRIFFVHFFTFYSHFFFSRCYHPQQTLAALALFS